MIYDALKNLDPTNTKAMLCVWVPEETQQKLQGLTGSAHQPDHVTILKLTPEYQKVAPTVWFALEDALRKEARYCLPFTTGVQGFGRFFSKNGPEEIQAIYASLSGWDFFDLRMVLTNLVDVGFPEIPFFQDRYGFIPHITLDYVQPEEETPDLRALNTDPPLSFLVDNLSLVMGNRVIKFELGTGEQETFLVDAEEQTGSVPKGETPDETLDASSVPDDEAEELSGEQQ